MKILLKAVRITDPQSPHFRTSKDILIENGVISKIATSLVDQDAETISIPQLNVSQGWVDFKASFKDPGSDESGGILKGLDEAAKGGFTHVGVLPTDEPTADHRAIIDYKIKASHHHAVQLHPIGAVTHKRKGLILAELADMAEAGVCWFSDDQSLSTRMLHTALLYSKDFNGKIMVQVYSQHFSSAFQVNEGKASTLTGLTGHPEVDERIEIIKAIELAKYTQRPLHISGVSAASSLALIEDARKDNVTITCDVHIMNLCFTEENTIDFDTRFKVLPVLRSEEDRKALVHALKNKTIDAVVTDHRNVIVDHKDTTFDEADYGTIQFPTAYAALVKHTALNSDQVAEILSVQNRMTFGIQTHPVDVGNLADLTLYTSDKEMVWNSDFPITLSPFHNTPLEGNVCGIIRGNQWIINQ